MEYKQVARVSMKAGAGGYGTLIGYASTYDVDRVNERVIPGAFKNLAQAKRDGWLALSHDWNAAPIGTLDVLREEPGKGLYFEASFHSTKEAQGVRTVIQERLQRGKAIPLSIGYSVLTDRQAPDGVRELVEVDLFEISYVQVPANPMAGAIAAKMTTRRATSEQIRNVALLSMRNGVSLPDRAIRELFGKKGY